MGVSVGSHPSCERAMSELQHLLTASDTCEQKAYKCLKARSDEVLCGVKKVGMPWSYCSDALLTLIRALVVSKLDYCSSVLAGLPGSLMRRPQSVLNSAARLVYSARRLERMTPLLREFHWLRVPERIQFRLCVLTYRCLHGSAPSYLAETLHLTSDMESRRRLRSGSTSSLMVPSSRRATLNSSKID